MHCSSKKFERMTGEVIEVCLDFPSAKVGDLLIVGVLGQQLFFLLFLYIY